MWIVIIAKGTRGDCQPYAHLAAGLVRRGHRVTLAVEASHRPLVEEVVGPSLLTSGKVELVGLHGDLEALQRDKEWQAILRSRVRTLLLGPIKKWLEDHYVSDAWEVLRAIRKAEPERPSAIVTNISVWLLSLPIAEGLGVPLVVVPVVPPAFPNPDHPPIFLHPAPLALPLFNTMAGRAALELFAQTFDGPPMSTHLRTLQKEVNAMTLDVRGCLRTALHLPFAAAYPSLLFPRPPAWPHNVTCCGALTGGAPSPPSSSASLAELQAFLDADPDDKPVVFSWGSVEGVREDLARLAVSALQLSGKRGILPRGWSTGASLSSLDPQADADLLLYARDKVLQLHDHDGPLSSVPHAWLFPRCSVVVHHGGAGTTATALYAGVPQVVLPVVADQYFWATRVGQAGLGPPTYLSAYDATPEALAAQIRHVSTEHFRVRATVVRVEAQEENGVANVMEVVERAARKGGKVFWGDVHAMVAEEHRQRVRTARIVLAVVAVGIGGLTYLVVRRTRKR